MKISKQTLKQIASCTLAIPAAVIATSEPNENEYWWIPFIAWGIIIALLKWNNIINLRER